MTRGGAPFAAENVVWNAVPNSLSGVVHPLGSDFSDNIVSKSRADTACVCVCVCRNACTWGFFRSRAYLSKTKVFMVRFVRNVTTLAPCAGAVSARRVPAPVSRRTTASTRRLGKVRFTRRKPTVLRRTFLNKRFLFSRWKNLPRKIILTIEDHIIIIWTQTN